MKNRFLHRDAKLTELSKSRFIIGIFLGVFFSVTFYSFLYLIRETFRVISVTETYEIWTLSDCEVSFYNLFFAFFAVIFGQSVCFAFVFDRPRPLFGNLHYRHTSIVNSQRALNWYFLNWISRLALIFGLFFGVTIKGGYYVFSLYPDYCYVFVLIIIFLFYQTWNTIRAQFKQRSVKWFLISVLIVSSFAIGLSRVNVINYKAINSIVQSKNINSKYLLDVPEAEYYRRPEKRSLVEHIYIVQEKNQAEDADPVIIADNKVVALNNLDSIIKQWQSERDEAEIPFMTYCLHINKTVRMEFFNKLKNEFFKLGVYRFTFAVTPVNPEFDKRYYRDMVFSISMYDYANASPQDLQDLVDTIKQIKNIIEVKSSGNNSYIVNGNQVSEKQLTSCFYNLISNDPDYLIEFYINDHDVFSSYLRVYNSSIQAVSNLRNKYSLENYQVEYGDYDAEEMTHVRELFPLRRAEMTDKMIELLDGGE